MTKFFDILRFQVDTFSAVRPTCVNAFRANIDAIQLTYATAQAIYDKTKAGDPVRLGNINSDVSVRFSPLKGL
ncbi:hypothetical protein AWR27_05350 [Spirosoma montaniterrae]|uniref:Uncharacterized protein n=1 Tax=Spirosoma montaniterrae TaxID=1178516 RepID=A0A1P9WTU1_9BACT|nr:hypothetical protein AWR27_05350 [Spirosoma montaniterrae]